MSKMFAAAWSYEAVHDRYWASEFLWWDSDRPNLPYSCWFVLTPIVKDGVPFYGRRYLEGLVTIG
jgi:hypothetical protein